MVEFTQWTESLIFAGVFSVIILVPCLLLAIIGRNVINKLGQYPTKTPAIQMTIVIPLIAIEIVTFTLLYWFYLFFAN